MRTADLHLYHFANWLFGSEWRRAFLIIACILFGARLNGGGLP